MSENYINLYFFAPETSKTLVRKDETSKKRKPNMFILYRTDMLKYRPNNITMTEFSKQISAKWKNLSEREKAELQKKYQIKRDQNLNMFIDDVDTNQGGGASKVSFLKKAKL
ncbi:3067_t:CDS:2 [Funneliformis mosseae]|uniref:3067_t:CDS:1 n=1 Tax=Funneliformis mosseae TaxID=27381 RepID=A0A9N9C8T1_FUNMO|nr:3067_t:CDS:2 [Funneliformis mosseae]